jgi:cytochrome P450
VNDIAPSAQIDLWSSASFARGHPVEMYRWLRDNDPVHWHEEPGGPGFWVVTRFGDVRTVTRNPETFSSQQGMTIGDLAPKSLERARSMLMFLDPPRHTRYRLLVNQEFMPRRVAGWSLEVEQLARRIINEVCVQGSCDLVTDIAGKLPSYVIAELMGIPLSDGVRLYELTETMHSAPDAVTAKERDAAAVEMLEYAERVFTDKSEHPGSDVATKLLAGEVDGERLSAADFAEFFLLLINAGGDTTRNVVGGAMDALFAHPDERARLQDDADRLMPTAVEEFVRWVSPVVYMRRTATADVELGGKTIQAGQKVVVFFGSANRDEEAFDDPDRLDVGRTPNDHVAFGAGGPHFCLGAHFARLEVGAMLREILTRLPDVEPAGPTTWLASNFISGPAHLPVRFTPQAPVPLR